mmetsp:Transcript_50817/g.142240  ORF Transcript_50817/g.142240 Transcript_50817/m.142240 type:complete len:273 (+) Transcript_50817:366-1184(+)
MGLAGLERPQAKVAQTRKSSERLFARSSSSCRPRAVLVTFGSTIGRSAFPSSAGCGTSWKAGPTNSPCLSALGESSLPPSLALTSRPRPPDQKLRSADRRLAPASRREAQAEAATRWWARPSARSRPRSRSRAAAAGCSSKTGGAASRTSSGTACARSWKAGPTNSKSFLGKAAASPSPLPGPRGKGALAGLGPGRSGSGQRTAAASPRRSFAGRWLRTRTTSRKWRFVKSKGSSKTRKTPAAKCESRIGTTRIRTHLARCGSSWRAGPTSS